MESQFQLQNPPKTIKDQNNFLNFLRIETSHHHISSLHQPQQPLHSKKNAPKSFASSCWNTRSTKIPSLDKVMSKKGTKFTKSWQSKVAGPKWPHLWKRYTFLQMDVCNIDIWNLEGFKKYVVCIYLDANILHLDVVGWCLSSFFLQNFIGQTMALQ